jgi:hypothetical protein
MTKKEFLALDPADQAEFLGKALRKDWHYHEPWGGFYVDYDENKQKWQTCVAGAGWRPTIFVSQAVQLLDYITTENKFLEMTTRRTPKGTWIVSLTIGYEDVAYQWHEKLPMAMCLAMLEFVESVSSSLGGENEEKET